MPLFQRRSSNEIRGPLSWDAPHCCTKATSHLETKREEVSPPSQAQPQSPQPGNPWREKAPTLATHSLREGHLADSPQLHCAANRPSAPALFTYFSLRKQPGVQERAGSSEADIH